MKEFENKTNNYRNCEGINTLSSIHFIGHCRSLDRKDFKIQSQMANIWRTFVDSIRNSRSWSIGTWESWITNVSTIIVYCLTSFWHQENTTNTKPETEISFIFGNYDSKFLYTNPAAQDPKIDPPLFSHSLVVKHVPFR